jgi:hypothetical protein
MYKVNSIFPQGFFLRTFIVLSKAKGDEDVGVKVRVRVQKSKVCQKKVKFLLFIMLDTSYSSHDTDFLHLG